MSNLSVVICTHDPRPDFMNRALAGLKAQDLPRDQWELVVVDNSSSPPLTGRFDLTWHPQARVVAEPQLGLTRARLRGIRESIGKLLVFVDDDNVLTQNYFSQVLAISMEFPQMGAFGGQCLPDFIEGKAPDWTKPYWHCLAIWEFDQDLWTNRYDTPCIPCGAGLVVKREVADAYLAACERDNRRVELDRQGKRLVSGGDYDLALCAVDLGLGLGKFHRLKLHHLMPLSRFQEEYLIQLWRGVHCSGKVLRYLRNGSAPKFQRSANQRIRRIFRLIARGRRDVHFRFGVAAEEGLMDADNIIASLGAVPFRSL